MVLQLDRLLIQLLLQDRLVALVVRGLELLVPELSPERVDLVLELADVPDSRLVPHLELSVIVALSRYWTTFSSLSSLNLCCKSR